MEINFRFGRERTYAPGAPTLFDCYASCSRFHLLLSHILFFAVASATRRDKPRKGVLLVGRFTAAFSHRRVALLSLMHGHGGIDGRARVIEATTIC